MNCCAPTGQCDDSHNCPAHATQPIKASRCNELGICQGLGADQCPDCDSFECEVPCADAPAPTRPLAGVRHPFAPGVIQRAEDDFYASQYGFPLDWQDWLYVLRVLLVFGGGMGLLVAWLTGRLA